MKTAKQIDNLWEQLQGFIDRAYTDKPQQAGALRDYSTNTGWHDDLGKLLNAETDNEKQHRRGKPDGFVPPISAKTAAKLILCGNFSRGSTLAKEPSAIGLLMFRHTAVEMEAIGYLCREVVTDEWRAAVEKLDYAQIMKAA